MRDAPPDISLTEAGIVTGFMVVLDFLQFLMVIVPILDLVTFLVAWALWIFGWCALNLYFLIRVGPSYLGGKRAVQKITATVATSVAGLFPFLNGFVPELTVQAVAMFWFLRKERQDYAASRGAAAA